MRNTKMDLMRESKNKNTNYAPFGSSQSRFNRLTIHPSLNPHGIYMVRPKACDPALYHPKPIHEIYALKNYKDPWFCKKELEAWSKNLGYRNQRILKDRKWFSSVRGPAWYDIPDTVRYEAACKNVGFGRVPRTKPLKNKTPGPGTYYNAVPFKAPFGPHSTRPTFEREDPCRFKSTTPSWCLAPDRYQIIDKECIEQKPKKMVSTRGPYDLFTGTRDESTIKNHFSTSQRVSAATWPYTLKGCLDAHKKTRLGVMNKTGRNIPHKGRNTLTDISMCYRRPDEPGPAHYNTGKPKVFKQNYQGFNSSYDRPPGYKKVVVWPGVGRYRLRRVICGLPGHVHPHVFLSKVQRTIGAEIPKPMNSF